MKGKAYLVSVGPGDPELMTLKALRTIEHCSVIAYPKKENNIALDIVKGEICLDGKILLPLEFTMSRSEDVRLESYRVNARILSEYAEKGMDVALINLGDVSVFSTAAYLIDPLKNLGIESVMIAGVTSFNAIASRLGISLTDMNEPLHIIPAGDENITESLKLKGTRVIMKSGKRLDMVLSEIRKAGLKDKTYMVSDCGMETEKIYRDIDEITDAGYFSTFVIKE
ncbi:MAG: precorrin-2 C(20)-methyltransferase [Clostridia bacterium]|nr:precorrin-2 C(20)-methyltransferase [Clostridia bacterium]